MFRLGRLLAIALIACTPRGPVRPAIDAPADGAGTTTPTATTARDQVLAAATARFVAERAAPIHDVALDAVAQVVANSASTGYVVATAGLRTALATHLGTGLDPYVLTARGDGAAIVAQLAPALAELRGAAGIAAVGVAAVPSADGEVVAVVAMPPPTSPIAIERDGVRARVLVPWSWPAAPRAFVVTDAGTRRLDVTQGARGAELTFDCTPGGSPTIEFEAGDLLVASVVNVCTPAPPSAASAVEVGPTARTAVEIEQRLFELINRDRGSRPDERRWPGTRRLTPWPVAIRRGWRPSTSWDTSRPTARPCRTASRGRACQRRRPSRTSGSPTAPAGPTTRSWPAQVIGAT
jgi:hypothetical protein